LDLNRYSYVENNPIELIDPNGLRPKRRKRRRKVKLSSTKRESKTFRGTTKKH